ncbi:unnamed protein product, partial [Linum tenue]
ATPHRSQPRLGAKSLGAEWITSAEGEHSVSQAKGEEERSFPSQEVVTSGPLTGL